MIRDTVYDILVCRPYLHYGSSVMFRTHASAITLFSHKKSDGFDNFIMKKKSKIMGAHGVSSVHSKSKILKSIHNLYV